MNSRRELAIIAIAYCLLPTASSIGFAVVRRDEDRAGAAGTRCFGQNAEATGDFLVGLEHAAEIAAEPVLVELVARRDVPQAAAVRADLVGEVDLKETDEAKAKAAVDKMCKDLLANTVIENYSYELVR